MPHRSRPTIATESTVDCLCQRCKTPFMIYRSEVQYGRGLFCGVACRGASKGTPLRVRFFDQVQKGESCWIWTGPKAWDGRYGTVSTAHATKRLSHRVSWEIHHGPIPKGIQVLHNCPGGDNSLCVNPDHLWLGTQLDNMRDRRKKGR